MFLGFRALAAPAPWALPLRSAKDPPHLGTKDGHRRTKHGLSTQDAKMLQVVPNGNLRKLPGNPRSSLLKPGTGQFGPQVRQDGPKGVPWRLKEDPGKPRRPKQAPRMPNELPSDLKMAQHGTNKAQGGCQGSPIWSIEGPRWLQAGSGTPKELPNKLQHGPRWPRDGPRKSPRQPKQPHEGGKDAQRHQKSCRGSLIAASQKP